MKVLIGALVFHIVGIALLIVLGLALNDSLKTFSTDYQGVVSVLSVGFGIYCFAINVFYHKSQRVYLLVNQILLCFRRTHTYWLPSFDFGLTANAEATMPSVIEQIEASLRGVGGKPIKIVRQSSNSASLALDDVFFLELRCNDGSLHVTLDRRILVPSHLYEAYRHRLEMIAEQISQAIRPDSVRLGITITFGDGMNNPYYGFFVHRVPSQVLRHFEATFLLDEGSSCRIEASADGINIEGKSFVEVFNALSQVLALKAAPVGGAGQ